MATCVQVPREPSIIPPKTFKLHLSEGEAQTLKAICDLVGGNAYRSRRKHMDAIGQALTDAGADFCTLFTTDQTSIHIKDEVGKVPE